MSSSVLPQLHLHVFGETVDNLCLVEQSGVKGSTGVWRLPENWRAWFPARFQNRTDGGSDRTSSFAPTTRVICKKGVISLQTMRILRLVSASKPRHIVIHSLTYSLLVATSGTRLVQKNHALVETARARVLPITVSTFKFLHIALTCAVEAPCVTINLNRMNECPSF